MEHTSLFSLIEIKIRFPTLLKDVNDAEILIITETVFITLSKLNVSGTSCKLHLAQCYMEGVHFLNSGSLKSFD